MDFRKRLEYSFLLTIVLALGYMGYSAYLHYRFEHNPLPEKMQARILERQQQMEELIFQQHRIRPDFPLVVSNEFHSNLYGVTHCQAGRTSIYLNKKRMKESFEYMIAEVIPHEYAHALLCVLSEKSSHDGHSQLWQKLCVELEGKICTQYVDNEEIIRQKMALFE